MRRWIPDESGVIGHAGRISRGFYDVLQADLSDEEFLIAMGNRLLELEQERSSPAALRWIKRNLLSLSEEISMPGLDLKRLRRLAGQEAPGQIDNDERYPVDYHQLRRLVDAAQAGQAGRPQK